MKLIQKKRLLEIRRRKNFFPSLVLTLLFWAALVFEIFYVDPAEDFALFAFFTLLFLSVLFTFSILFINTRRGFFVASVTTMFAILRYFGIGSLLNFALLIFCAIAFEVYFSKKLD